MVHRQCLHRLDNSVSGPYLSFPADESVKGCTTARRAAVRPYISTLYEVYPLPDYYPLIWRDTSVAESWSFRRMCHTQCWRRIFLPLYTISLARCFSKSNSRFNSRNRSSSIFHLFYLLYFIFFNIIMGEERKNLYPKNAEKITFRDFETN